MGIYQNILRHLDGAAIRSYFGAPPAENSGGGVERSGDTLHQTFRSADGCADNISAHDTHPSADSVTKRRTGVVRAG